MALEFTWLRNLGAMIDEDTRIMVWCEKCKATKKFTREDLIALADKAGRDFDLRNRRCKCRLTRGCRGWNRFYYLLAVYRPLFDPQIALVWMKRDRERKQTRMCNRAMPGDREKIANLFDIKKIHIFNDGPRIVHPRDPGPVVRIEDGELVLDQMTWGFPVVLKGKQGQDLKPKAVNNARFDKLNGFWRRWATQPQHRCLIPTAKYSEAVGTPGKMTCAWLALKSTPVFAWAGLWNASEEWGPVYTGVMTDNAPEHADIHDRSPVILAPQDWQTWLTAPLEELYQFDRPWPADDVVVERSGVLWKEGGDVSRYSW